MQSDPARLPPLDLLAAFEAAARHLSFTKAAQERFLTQSAVSRQVQALEAALGAALFIRRHRALSLTDEGQQLLQAVSAALTTLRGTVAQIRAPRRRAVVALTTTPGLASLWLIPHLSAFMQAHPGVDVRIDASLARRDLAADGYDIAIRYARTGASEGAPLFAETTLPVCAPALLRDRRRPLNTPADLRAHTLLQVTIPPGASVPYEWQPWLQAVGAGELEPAATLTFSNYDAAVAAAVAGQGVALGRRPLVVRCCAAARWWRPSETRSHRSAATFWWWHPARVHASMCRRWRSGWSHRRSVPVIRQSPSRPHKLCERSKPNAGARLRDACVDDTRHSGGLRVGLRPSAVQPAPERELTWPGTSRPTRR